MEIQDLRRQWNGMGQEDPLWAILTVPSKAGGRWKVEEFFATSRQRAISDAPNLEACGAYPLMASR